MMMGSRYLVKSSAVFKGDDISAMALEVNPV